MDAKADASYYDGYRTDLNHLLPQGAKRVLEIGGGSGAFRQNFAPDVEYWLVEPVATMAVRAEGKVDRVIVGMYKDAEGQLPDAYFDLVVCNDVIEHMPDWREFLVAIQRKIGSAGKLVGSIPNVRHFVNVFNFLVKRDWEYTQTGILETTHYAFFTEKSLRRELRSANLRIEQFDLMKKLTYTPEQSRLKYALSLLLIALMGRDTRYGQFGFRCALSRPAVSPAGFEPLTIERAVQ